MKVRAVSKPPRWADPHRPLAERLLAAGAEIAKRDTGDGQREVMRELVEAELVRAERTAWVEAPSAPAEWEGTVVLFDYGDGRPVERRFLSLGYSRDPRHCGGIRVRKMPEAPPAPYRMQ